MLKENGEHFKYQTMRKDFLRQDKHPQAIKEMMNRVE